MSFLSHLDTPPKGLTMLMRGGTNWHFEAFRRRDPIADVAVVVHRVSPVFRRSIVTLQCDSGEQRWCENQDGGREAGSHCRWVMESGLHGTGGLGDLGRYDPEPKERSYSGDFNQSVLSRKQAPQAAVCFSPLLLMSESCVRSLEADEGGEPGVPAASGGLLQWIGPTLIAQAKMSVTMRDGLVTLLSRWSSPWKGKVRRLWSKPSRVIRVAWKSWALTRSMIAS